MPVRLRLIAGVAIVASALLACDKSSGSAPDAQATADPAATTPASLDDPKPAATSAKSPPPPPSARVVLHPHASASASAAPPPSRPLADWMRGPATQAFNSGDLESIASVFDQMIPWAPKPFTNWASIARDGSQAARAGSIEGVKAACRSCHAQYDVPYRATFSSSPLP